MTAATEDEWHLLDNASGWLRHAEAKLTAALGFVGVLGAGLFALAANMEKTILSIILACGAAACLVIAGGVVFRGLIPKRASVDVLSTVYYADIAQCKDSTEYVDSVRAADHDLPREILRQVYNIAVVADAKYDDCHCAYGWLGGAVAVTSILAALRVVGFA